MAIGIEVAVLVDPQGTTASLKGESRDATRAEYVTARVGRLDGKQLARAGVGALEPGKVALAAVDAILDADDDRSVGGCGEENGGEDGLGEHVF